MKARKVAASFIALTVASWGLITATADAAVITGNVPTLAVPVSLTTATGASAPVSGVNVSANGQASAQYVVSAAHGTLSLSVTTGLTFSSGYLNGGSSVAFSSTTAAAQTALGSLQYTPVAGFQGVDTINYKSAPAGAIYNPSTGHFYQFVNAGSNITWPVAKSGADASSFYGLHGYLATVSSSTEQALISSKLTAQSWFGASDDSSQSTTAPHWIWADGPEKGTEFYNGYHFSGSCAVGTCLPVGGAYTNWLGGQPDNYSSLGVVSSYNESFGLMQSSGGWNDSSATSVLNSYVVEYGGTTGDSAAPIDTQSTAVYVGISVPGTPTAVAATTSVGQSSISWSAPASNGGATIDAYKVEYSADGTTWTTASTSATSPYTLTGLSANTTYQVRVTGHNGVGYGTASTAASFTTAAVPGAPTAITQTHTNNAATVSWTAPASNGGSAIDAYKLDYSLDGTTWTTASTTATSPYSLTGLTTGTAYQVRVSAHNGVGYSTASATTSFTTNAVAGAPTSLSQTHTDTSATITWSAPTSDGGAAIDGYKVEYNNGGAWTSASTSATSPLTVTGLTAGTAYTFRIFAHNSVGYGSAAATISLTTLAAPTAPISVTATNTDTTATVTWAAPASDGGSAIDSYKVEYSTDGTTWTTSSAAATSPYAVTGLTAGTAYQLRVSAHNAVGYGITSNVVSLTTYALPSAPLSVTSTPAATSASIGWTVPASNGGTAVDGYKVEYSTNGTSWTTAGTYTATPATITGLASGVAYQVRVSAHNSVGYGAASTASSFTTWATPGAPTSVGTTYTATAAVLTWTAPASNGGTAVDTYKVEYSANGGSTWLTASTSASSPYSLSGLTAGTAYQVRVSAHNSVGYGATSTAASFTTLNVPGTPTALSTTNTNTSAVVSWTAPSSNGGSAIDGYKVEYSTDGTTWSTIATGVASPYTLSGLSAGTNYYVRVSAHNAVGYSAATSSASFATWSLPTAPVSLTETHTATSATIAWNAPTSNGGTAIDNYKIEYSFDGLNWAVGATTAASTYAATGLPAGTTYYARVSAHNAVGYGPVSSVVSLTTWTPPGAPTSVTQLHDNSTATVSWVAPTANGGTAIDNYKVEYSTDGSTWVANTATTSPYTITGLSPGVSYQVRVSAHNAAGYSSAASASAFTTWGAPTAPTSVSETHNNNSAALSWNVPASNGGTAIDTYKVEYSTNGTTWTVASSTAMSPYSLTGLNAATAYQVRVTAHNLVGYGASSSVVSFTTLDVPGAPLSLAQTHTNATATVSWNAPSSSGGAAVDGYKVEYSTDGVTWVTAASGATAPYTLSGLTAGTAYQVRVSAHNSIGYGTVTSPATFTTWTVPTVPLSISETHDNNSAAISWSAPTSDGGTTVDVYKVEYSTDGVTWNVAATSANSPYSLTGLSPSTNYQVRVTAHNTVGYGATSGAVAFTTLDVPTAPLSLAQSHTSTTATVTWAAPANIGGAAVDAYKVEYSTDGTSWLVASSAATSPYTLSGLTTGTDYQVRVSAHNAIGFGNTATLVSFTTWSVPTVVNALAQTHTDTTATASWLAPTTAGGTAVDGYKVEYSTDGITWTAAASGANSPYLLTGLIAGTSYQLRVTAHNVVGYGPAATTSFTTWAVPNTPLNLAEMHDNTSASLAWNVPASDGGTAIDAYKVEYSTNGTTWTVATTSASSPYDLTGLTAATTYQVRVSAHNVVGYSPATASLTFVTLDVPGIPQSLTETHDDTSAAISWAAPAIDGGTAVDGYKVEYSTDGVAWVTAATNATSPYSLTGLTAGTVYEVRVSAHNPIGYGSVAGPLTLITLDVPGVVASLSESHTSTSATLSWPAPVANGGASVDGYKVEYSTDGSTWTTAATLSSSPLVLNGLTAGTTYQVRVSAHNSVGYGAAINPISITTWAVPGAPLSLSQTHTGSTATLTWAAPTDNGGTAVDGYQVEYSTDGTNWTTAASGANSPYTLSGLTSGTAYQARVTAHNSVGFGSPTAAVSFLAWTVPAAPTSVASTNTSSAATITWVAPADGGAAIDGYKVEYSTHGTSWITASTSASSGYSLALNTGLAYQVRVSAHNAVGYGSASSSTSFNTFTVPRAPTGISEMHGDSSATISWNDPSSDGGTAIDGYKIEYSTDNTTWAANTTSGISPYLLTGLSAATTYQVRVAAHNAVGYGPVGGSVYFTTLAVPDMPTNVTATNDSTSATVTWNAPIFTGNTTIDGYKLETSTDGNNWTVASTSATSPFALTGLNPGTQYFVRVNAYNSVGNGMPNLPISFTTWSAASAPLLLATTHTTSTATLTWAAPASNGGTAVDGYEVDYSTDASNWTVAATGATSPYTLSGLNSGTAYNVRVSAHNAVSYGAFAAASFTTDLSPAIIPASPTALSATTADASTVLTWLAPSYAGTAAVDGYKIETSTDGVNWATAATTSATVYGLTGLHNGDTYSIRISAHNAVGYSAPSASIAVTPMAIPGAPATFDETHTGTTATLSWTAPVTNGGSAITGVIVDYRTATGQWQTVSTNGATPFVITGLTPSTEYTVRVRATNAIGVGQADTLTFTTDAIAPPSTTTTTSTVPATTTTSTTVPAPTTTTTVVAPTTTTSTTVAVLPPVAALPTPVKINNDGTVSTVPVYAPPVDTPKPAVVAATASGDGSWTLTPDGGVFTAGDASFYGSMGGTALAAPAVGLVPTANGDGYFIVAADGGVFAFGNAVFAGSAQGITLNAPVTGIGTTCGGAGYYLVAADGGVFAYGDAGFSGSMAGRPLNAPMEGVVDSCVGNGYWTYAKDGGVFAFGDAGFYGSLGGRTPVGGIVGMVSAPDGRGYWLIGADNKLYGFGSVAN